MSGLEKIIEQITTEAKEKADGIIASASDEAEKLLASEKESADNMAAAILRQSDLDVAAAVKRIQSTSEIREKRVILQAKQDRIEEIYKDALDHLQKMGDDEYFKTIEKMLSRYASGQKGQICFSDRDLKRLPENITKVLAGYQLSVSDTPADISGGFILSYGDIEENCSFDVLMESSKEELQDKISALLFG